MGRSGCLQWFNGYVGTGDRPEDEYRVALLVQRCQMISFATVPDTHNRGCHLVYRRSEYAFDTEGPRPPECKASISINEVQLEYGDDKRVRCVTGYCPYQGWKSTSWSPPDYSIAALIVLSPQKITAGAATGLNDLNSRWPVYINAEGWVCLGEPSERGEQAVEFAPGSVAVLRGDTLVALWLRPAMLGD